MAVIHGNAVGIFIDADADGVGESYELVACATSATMSLNNAIFEATCKSDTAGVLDDASSRYTGAGQQTWSMSVDGLVDLTAGTSVHSYVDLMTLALDRTEIKVVFRGSTGQQEYSGLGYISSVEATASVDDFITYSCTIEGNGALTAATTA